MLVAADVCLGWSSGTGAVFWIAVGLIGGRISVLVSAVMGVTAIPRPVTYINLHLVPALLRSPDMLRMMSVVVALPSPRILACMRMP
jgi:hypothetical protein